MDVLLALTGIPVGALLVVTGQRIAGRLRPQPTCAWCATASGWPVAGHSPLECRGYITDVRRRNPSFGGNAWREPDSRS
ncbi:hypothetical protein [Streptomyces californicus]|uniref:hypothetical protein n=1 Tax=Streptomyces californicus TaxID=67351 RepID=UPI00371F02E9